MSKLKAFLTISRAKIQLGTPPHPLLGLILGSTAISQLISPPSLIYIVLYFLLITFACNINCLYDVEVDEKYKKHMSHSVNELGKSNVKKIITTEAIAAFLLMFYLFSMGYYITSLLALSGLLFGYMYSAEPLRVKKKGFWSPFPVLIGLYTLPVLGGWFIFQNTITFYILVFVVGYALLNEGITLVNTCEDYKEDNEEGIKTWAHVLGMEKTIRIAFLFTFIGGLLAVLGVLLKPIMIGWSYYATISTFVFIALGVLNTFLILKTSKDIYDVPEMGDLERSCKLAAKNMPKWFITTRYPLLIMSIAVLLLL